MSCKNNLSKGKPLHFCYRGVGAVHTWKDYEIFSLRHVLLQGDNTIPCSKTRLFLLSCPAPFFVDCRRILQLSRSCLTFTGRKWSQ